MQIRIALDTNVYRQLGLTFYEHPDYKSLDDYCYSSGAHMMIALTVIWEYLAYYKHEVLEKSTADLLKNFERLQKLPEFKSLKTPTLAKRSERQLNLIKQKLTEYKEVIKTGAFFDEEQLIDFLIANKNENKKDNTRDYLIWLSLLFSAYNNDEDQVIFISDDRIFTENGYFKDVAAHYKISNVKVFTSISAFLSIYGFKSPDLTADVILNAIPIEPISEALLEHKNDIPSHISRFYYHTERDFKLELYALKGIRLQSFYAHKDLENDEVAIIAHVMADVDMRYEPEPQADELAAYLASPKPNRYFLETFDEKGRPIFQEEMLFLYRLTYDEKQKKITSATYIDFFPDEYQIKRAAEHRR